MVLKIILNKMDLESKIYIAGHKGMVGSAITKNLANRGYNNLVFNVNIIYCFIFINLMSLLSFIHFLISQFI